MHVFCAFIILLFRSAYSQRPANRRLARPNGLEIESKTSKRVRQRYKFACVKSQHSTDRPADRTPIDSAKSECEPAKQKRKTKKKTARSKCGIERLMLSSYGVYCVRIRSHKYIFGYIMEIYVRPRPSKRRHTNRIVSRTQPLVPGCFSHFVVCITLAGARAHVCKF